jgi:hypothetical protein
MTDSPLSPQTRKALDAFRERTDEPISRLRTASLVKAALGAHRRRQPVVRNAGLFVAACLVGALGFRAVFERASSTPVEEVQASPSARWQWDGASLKLDSGRARIEPQRQRVVTVVTPELEAVLRSSAAMFDVTEAGTTLVVELGEVTWRADGRSGRLVAGQRLTIATATPALSVAPRGPLLEDCAQSAREGSYEDCLVTAARESGLAAETALFELGLLAHERADASEAVRHFRAYGERFPNGAFGPEASIALMLELKAAGQKEAAAAEATRFLARFADEPRAARVQRWADQFR